MEPEIQTSLPGGSPILAYGESHKPPTKTILALLAGVLVAVIFAFAIWMNYGWHTALPEQTVVIAAIHGKANLPSAFPALWRHATEQSSHPLFLGLARQEQTWVPFVITSRFDTPVGTEISIDGIFSFQSDLPLARTDRRPVRPLLGLLWLTFSHQAAMSATFSDTDKSETMIGPIDQGVWRTTTNIAHPTQQLPQADISLDLSSLPGAWEALSPFLTPYPLPLELADMPSLLVWKKGPAADDALELDFPHPPSTSTRQIVTSANSHYASRPYSLNDGTISAELLLPSIEMDTTTSSTTSTVIAVPSENYRLRIGSPDTEFSGSVSCGTRSPVMHISATALNMLIERLRLPFAPITGSLTIAEDQGKASLCFE